MVTGFGGGGISIMKNSACNINKLMISMSPSSHWPALPVDFIKI